MNIIVTANGTLFLDGKRYRCSLGKSGVVSASEKREGDGATPDGCYTMRKLFYRPDKFGSAPDTKLPSVALSEKDGWSDDSSLPEYNTFVAIPYEGSHEVLWRQDDVYDLIVPLGYNDNPAIPGKGSAIFMHIAREGYTPTSGCIALSRDDLLEVLCEADSTTQVCIER